MKIKDVLQRDPTTHPLANQGQARISDSRDGRALSELRAELETFVCEGQYADGMQRIIRSFLDNLGRTSQRGAWVSGFFGNGKSHLLKMLCHLWQDTPFPDGGTARSLVPSLPEDLRHLLRELDTAGRRAGGLIAAAGSLPGGTSDTVRLTVLAILLRAVGLPELYPQARFCLWLHSHGYFDAVTSAIEAVGRNFERELNNLYVSGPIARAVMACDPDFAASEADARQLLKAQFPPQVTDITTGQFLSIAKEALSLRPKDGRPPLTLLILDEAQQYIGDSQQRASLLTEVTEAVSKQLDSHVMVVAAGQNALLDVPLLAYLLDRFTIRVPLSDADVETVTRKVLLQKKPSAVPAVRQELDKFAGEVSRQLQGTRIAETIEDRAVIVEDYPLLPVRRRFWENAFRQIDAAGTSSQLRSQLGILHEALAQISERPLGALVPADQLYTALSPKMIMTGVLLREISERIIEVGRAHGEIARRLCSLVFLIGRLKRDAGADIGVRATREHLADLLIDDLDGDNGKLRSDAAATLEKLAQDGILMLVGDEFRLQTREGAEWDREFRNVRTRLLNDPAAIPFKRDQLLYSEMEKAVRSIRLRQGAANEARQFTIHREQTPPKADGGGIPVWIRDGWSCSEKEVVEAARAAGIESPVLFVLIPRQSADDLRNLIAEADAAEQTLNARGNPTTAEGQEARLGAESRRAHAAAERDRLVADIVGNAKLYQGGGSEVLSSPLQDRIKAAAEASLIRLFPRFKEADSPAWEAVIKRAREGADHPFQPAGHADATEKHPVCQQVIATIGAGKSGSEIRKPLSATPFGWPRDAIDAALIALTRLQHVTATLNGQAIPPGQLDQNRIPKAEFRVEQATLSVPDRLALRKLFQALGISCKSGEEAARASAFLVALIALAKSAGGDAPLPAAPATTEIEDIQRLAGNQQLVAIKARAAEWEERIRQWSATRDQIAARQPTWNLVERLAKHAAVIPEARPELDEIEAIRSQRLLLEPLDPASTIRQSLAGLLRDTIRKAQWAHESAFNAVEAALAANGIWCKLPASERESIQRAVGLTQPAKAAVGTDQALAEALERKPLSAIRAEIDATAGRASQAIERAARFLEPKVQSVTLERSTLRNEAEVDSWLERQRATLLSALAAGPVLVS